MQQNDSAAGCRKLRETDAVIAWHAEEMERGSSDLTSDRQRTRELRVGPTHHSRRSPGSKDAKRVPVRWLKFQPGRGRIRSHAGDLDCGVTQADLSACHAHHEDHESGKNSG